MMVEDVIDHVSRKTKVSKRTARVAVRSAFAAIAQAMHRHERVAVPAFGAFCVSRRRGRRVLHPATGLPVRIRAGFVPAFRPFDELRHTVRTRRAK
jgi:nucleoid DNA-binding protein